MGWKELDLRIEFAINKDNIQGESNSKFWIDKQINFYPLLQHTLLSMY